MIKFSVDVMFFFTVFMRMCWNSFWVNMIEYHNRVQRACDDGRDVFKKEGVHANV